MIDNVPELGEFRLYLRLGPEPRLPELIGAGTDRIFQRLDAGAELMPKDFLPNWAHVNPLPEQVMELSEQAFGPSF